MGERPGRENREREQGEGEDRDTRRNECVVRQGVMVCDHHVRVQQDRLYQAARFAPGGLVTGFASRDRS